MKNGDMPANPQSGAEQWDSSDYGCRGLTKREHFAVMAMQGLCANSGVYKDSIPSTVLAKQAIANADALLKALGDD